MDPFLEQPVYFTCLQARLVSLLAQELRQRLPRGYTAATEDRLWQEPIEASPAQDQATQVDLSAPVSPAADGLPARAGLVVVTVPHLERRETFVEIFKHSGDDQDEQLVTLLEVLTPAVKMSGQRGRDVYLHKQRECLDKPAIHLVEIDLLRAGEHTTAVPVEALRQQGGKFDYHVCVSHGRQRDKYHVYPIRLEQRLPEVVVPLLPADGVALLDVQAVFERCYTTGPYSLVRYDLARLEPPLPPAQREWAARLLRPKG
jgi:hypothetical protein